MSILDAEIKTVGHVAHWKLAQPASFEPFTPGNSVPATADSREVPDNEKSLGATYYSIARLRMKYASDPNWYVGSGFMISEDIMVTAGHNVWDWTAQQSNPATVIEAYFGNATTGWVETRYAVSATIAEQYVTEDANGNWIRDFALLRLSPRQSPDLTPLKPFKQGNLDFAGKMPLFIVGYPAAGSDGKKMIESDAEVTWKMGKWNQAPHEPGPKGDLIDFSDDKWKYSKLDPKSWNLPHTVTTFGGVSGAPVLQAYKETFVGVHVAGTGNVGVQSNSACPVGGIGRVVGPYVRVLNGQGNVRKTQVKGGISVDFVAIDGEKDDHPSLM